MEWLDRGGRGKGLRNACRVVGRDAASGSERPEGNERTYPIPTSYTSYLPHTYRPVLDIVWAFTGHLNWEGHSKPRACPVHNWDVFWHRALRHTQPWPSRTWYILGCRTSSTHWQTCVRYNLRGFTDGGGDSKPRDYRELLLPVINWDVRHRQLCRHGPNCNISLGLNI